MSSNPKSSDSDQHQTARSGSGQKTAKKHKKAEKPKKEYDIDIFEAWCKSCGICAAFCPRKCIRLDEDGSPFVKDPKRCTGCGWCEVHCPDFAISIRPKKVSKIEEE